ncbi:MAG: Bug family tripartite tricarboxylate transporter substrate binding protein [Alphaproteobacteria bacterium]
MKISSPYASRPWFVILACLAGASLFAGAAAAQSVEAFYKKNGFRMVVASGAGGGFDTYARVLARHYGKYLPGHPSIVVQNMPGASGMLATNWAYNSAPRDGSRILATYNAILSAHLLGNDKAKFDIRKFGAVGSIAKSQLLCVTWHTSPYKDIRQVVGKSITVSATGRTGNSTTLPLILNQLMGTKFKVIMGYSTSGSRLALERGEVDGICGLGLSTLRASNPDWFLKKKINVIAQIGLTSLPELKGVTNPIDLVGPKEREVLEFNAILQEMGRPYVAPPEVPADRLAALRAAFDATMADKAFAAELDKLQLELSPLTGAEMEKWLGKLYAYSPEVVARVGEILGVATKSKIDDCATAAKDTKQCAKKKKKKKKS